MDVYGVRFLLVFDHICFLLMGTPAILFRSVTIANAALCRPIQYHFTIARMTCEMHYAFLGVFGQFRLKTKLRRVKNAIKTAKPSSNQKYSVRVWLFSNGTILVGSVTSRYPLD
jgi:hypothetical protein